MDMTRTPAELIWCGASAPVIQGMLIGLGAITVGLMLFPFETVLIRPTSGRLSKFGQAKKFMKWGKRLAWVLAVFTILTIAGYVGLYVTADGKFCTAKLSSDDQHVVIAWLCVGVTTFAVACAAWIFRWHTRRSTDNGA